MKIFYLILFCISNFSYGTTFDLLKAAGKVHEKKPVRLHLGCGEQYLKEYVNIDFPSEEHTAQKKLVADLAADITKLSFPKGSVDEVRNHHVFEHFPRPTALALLCAWHYWLKKGGKLKIETPDFMESINILMKKKMPYSTQQKIMRHLFGSHEAKWAIHCDGWYKKKFKKVLRSIGFEQITFKKSTYLKYIKNLTIRAIKKENVSLDELKERAKSVLRESLIDNSESENQIFEAWCTEFDQALAAMVYYVF